MGLSRIWCFVSADVGLDIQDDQGRHEVGFVENTAKKPIMDGKGCLFEANFQINKVPGMSEIRYAVTVTFDKACSLVDALAGSALDLRMCSRMLLPSLDSYLDLFSALNYRVANFKKMCRT